MATDYLAPPQVDRDALVQAFVEALYEQQDGASWHPDDDERHDALLTDATRMADVALAAFAPVLARLDPPDEAGQRRRIDELAARAFGPGYSELRALIRDELITPTDPEEASHGQ